MREVFFGCAITGVQAISDVSVLRQELQEAASISEFALRQRFLPDEADPSPRKRRSRPAGGIPWQTPQESTSGASRVLFPTSGCLRHVGVWSVVLQHLNVRQQKLVLDSFQTV